MSKKFLLIYLLSLSVSVYAADINGSALEQYFEKNIPKISPKWGIDIDGLDNFSTINSSKYSDQTVFVKKIDFTGATLFEKTDLEHALIDKINQNLNLAQIEQLAADISTFYRRNNYLAYVYLPPQDIQNGILELAILEATIGDIYIFGENDIESQEDDEFKRFVSSYIYSNNPKGSKFNLSKIYTAINLINSFPGVSISASLQAGEHQGETDLVITRTASSKQVFSLGADNMGATQFGSNRITGSFGKFHLATVGDRLQSDASYTAGSKFIQLSYSRPLGLSGLQAGLKSSAMNYQGLTSSDTTPQGSNYTIAGFINLPLQKTGKLTVDAGLSIEHKQFYNQTVSSPIGSVSNYHLNRIIADVNSQALDNIEIPSKGYISGGISITIGNVNLNHSPNQMSDAQGANTQGTYGKLGFSLTKFKSLDHDIDFVGNLSGQFSNRNLDGVEKFFLGGSSGIRAYPTLEGAGTNGLMLNVELKKKLYQNQMTIASFYDFGSIVQYKRNLTETGAAFTPINAYNLSGIGAYVDFIFANGIQSRLTFSHRLNTNPAATTTGLDGDGSKILNRVWLSLRSSF